MLVGRVRVAVRRVGIPWAVVAVWVGVGDEDRSAAAESSVLEVIESVEVVRRAEVTVSRSARKMADPRSSEVAAPEVTAAEAAAMTTTEAAAMTTAGSRRRAAPQREREQASAGEPHPAGHLL